jgi:hypothetical protein
MKAETNGTLDLAPREERAILDQIRNDRELIARLSITPQEIEALSKCALLGTLTCKQDMLFILRQIREATSATIDHAILFPQPASVNGTEDEDPVPGLRQIAIRVAPTIIPQPDARDTVVRRRIPAKVGVLFWVVVLVGGLASSGVLVTSRWRDNFVTAMSTAVSQTSSWGGWYDKLDHLKVLLFWEAMTVIAITTVMYLRSRRGSSRFKVRPGQRLR